MFFDAHVHTAASPDSEMDPCDAIYAAKKLGLGVIFTEHCDFVTSNGRNPGATDFWKNGKSDFICDFNIYPHEYKNLRSPSVLLGLEIGLTAAYYDKNKLTAEGDFDFILGSVHSAYGVDVYFDNPSDYVDFIRRYLTYSREMVEMCGFFDSFGHVDYVSRYNPDAQKVFRYENYAAEFDALFKAIIERDIAIEINSSGFTKFENYAEVLFPIYKRFAELGGKYCTIGSDAHVPERIGENYFTAKTLADTADLQVVYYKERKRCICGE